MTGPSLGHVHICHNPADRGYAERLYRHLTKAGVSATMDEEQSERLDPELVQERVEPARALVVVMRSGDELAPRVRDEVHLADRLGREIRPLSVGGKAHIILSHLPIADAAGDRMPDDDFVNTLRRIVGSAPKPVRAQPRRPRWRVPALVFAAVILVVGAVALFSLRDRGDEAVGPADPSASVPAATGLPAAPTGLPARGAVTITSPANDAVVDRCMKVTGRANLDTAQTILFATNRIDPPDTAWYVVYAGAYPNGFVDADWHGSVYLGHTTGQSFDVFVVVMEAKSAAAYYAAHKQGNGSYAVDNAQPAGAVAHVRVTQGSNDAC
ncbi:toll/interleukin-1 receptor domain-containing protein [Dactylosporangium matsuzakiense]|uniref:TIR domain-containing protein n=1 Tax=Dactylosporangium matsuzakiense TaxID=53360 RepID=A0A9W6KNT6_9ACTN|nr:toll/interleukin-1 receptor domain-containing protein [Dactylosporangium matsuzakiense]UWZ48384.1 toll/interleukin-1 receptor domain-containing protein [Dactylosporangium matsuzakiense]GLL05461.1 hypothetical protein GCM10017581_072080 [Dactylosporangium matsuzakiense]